MLPPTDRSRLSSSTGGRCQDCEPGRSLRAHRYNRRRRHAADPCARIGCRRRTRSCRPSSGRRPRRSKRCRCACRWSCCRQHVALPHNRRQPGRSAPRSARATGVRAWARDYTSLRRRAAATDAILKPWPYAAGTTGCGRAKGLPPCSPTRISGRRRFRGPAARPLKAQHRRKRRIARDICT